MKTKIVIVLILIASIAMFSTGAFAYWSSTQQITGSVIKAGSLGLLLGNDCRTVTPATFGGAAKAWEFNNLAPGDFVENTVCMKNTGSLDMGRVWYDWTDLVNNPANKEIAKYLKIIDIQDNDDGALNQVGVFNGIGVNTLYDLAQLNADSVWSATSVYPFIPAQGTGWVYMKLQFMTDAPDTLQEAQVTYNLTIKGVQKLPGNQ